MASNTVEEDVLKHFGGMTLNNLKNILLDITDVEQTIDTVSHSPYIDTSIIGGYMKKFSNHFSVLSLNIQCLNAKFEPFSLFIHDLKENGFKFSVICLQETWLQNVNDSLFQIPGYKSISLSASCSSHGGLITYVSDEFQVTDLNLYESSPQWEGLFLDVFDNWENKFTICNIYRPPRDTNDALQSFIRLFAEKLDVLSNCTNLIIAGDFNINLLSLNLREKYSDYFNLMINNGLTAHMSLPTRLSKYAATLIDHIFTKSSSSHISSQSGIILSQISDHLPIFICLEQKVSKTQIPKYIQIQKCNDNTIESFCSEINHTNFVSILDTNPVSDPSENYNKFHDCISEVMNKHMPLKTVRFKRYEHKIAPWVTSGILRSIKFKDKLYKKLKSTKPTQAIYETYKTNLNTYKKY
jgi:endonuclease/exonuclease/phosphatase family metal-dependent hydrolase